MPRKKVASSLPPERGIQYMQLEYFKLYSYCVDQGILKKGRRRTPSGAAALASPMPLAPLEAAEAVLIRLFGKVLRSIFDGSIGEQIDHPGIAKMRNVLEFTVLLPRGGWWQGEDPLSTRPEIINLGNAESAAYDRFVCFSGSGQTVTVPHILVAPDGNPGSSRWGRRRFETLLKENKSKGNYYDAAKAVVAWKERMDALMAEAADNVENGNQNTD